MNSRRLASSLLIIAALAAAGATFGARGLDEDCVFRQILRAIEPSLDQGSPF